MPKQPKPDPAPAPIQLVPTASVRLNEANPRLIKDNRFEQLVQSLIDFPEMLRLRPIVVDENLVALGGNMRLRAAQRLGYLDVPVVQVTGWSDEQKRQFVIKDNASFGEWNWEQLANEWSELPLEGWGIDLPRDWLEVPVVDHDGAGGESGTADFDFDKQPKECTLTIKFASPEQLQQAEQDVTELIDRKYNGASFTVQVGKRNG
ncbi:MAG: ParB N-terminal domain-containing protein [Janthinobacterium lividum]